MLPGKQPETPEVKDCLMWRRSQSKKGSPFAVLDIAANGEQQKKVRLLEIRKSKGSYARAPEVSVPLLEVAEGPCCSQVQMKQ